MILTASLSSRDSVLFMARQSESSSLLLNWLQRVLTASSRVSANCCLSLVSLYCIQLLLSLASWSRAATAISPPLRNQCSLSDLVGTWSTSLGSLRPLVIKENCCQVPARLAASFSCSTASIPPPLYQTCASLLVMSRSLLSSSVSSTPLTPLSSWSCR